MAKRFRTLVLSALLALISLPVQAAELVMVEEPGCYWCILWNRELGPIYPKTAEGRFAPLRRVQLSEMEDAGIAFARPVVFTPTFVLVENGQELGRIEGYPGEDFFWGLLERILVTETAFLAVQG